ncbi:Uma2 family endonuclease [Anaerolineales bacterium HSG25]|nr:Uma2 family endonuclease [Anaerolineales bacterium HSG25]
MTAVFLSTTKSQVESSKPQQPPINSHDPYVYGWRYEAKLNEEGAQYHARIPLTLEDVLHPQEDDFRMHSYDHERICKYLSDVFEMQLSDNPTAVILADVRVAWDKPDIKPHTPDISVVFEVKHHQNWSTFYEAQEGTRPILAVEITSPSTRHVDLVEKFDEYEHAGLAYYVIIDKHKRWGEWRRRLLGYQLTPTGYEQITPNEQGWLWLEPVQIWLTWEDDNLVCYNQTGERIPDYTNITKAYAEAQTRAENEAKVRREAENRATKAEARASAEKQARLEMEERLKQLEAELQTLKKQ